MKIKILKLTVCLILLVSFFSISSCEALDDLNDTADDVVSEAVDEILGITALSEDLNKTTTNFNIISDIVINNKLVSSSEIKMTLPSIVSISFTKKRYTQTSPTGGLNLTTNSYSGTISKSKFNKASNVVKITVQNNTPTVYVNNVATTTSGSGGTGGTGTTPVETKLVDKDVTGKVYQLSVVSFVVPTGVKTMVVKTNEPNDYYRNLADLFLRKDSAPIVAGPKPPTYLPKYTWTADYISHTPNREVKICTISNPSSGTWYAGLYGYNSDYQSRLTVTITK
ncbi:hypothetical protein [Flavobacterium sp.]|uniref:hypothetical protein n=1 Tax=Flavobacterium sp. TaxID=239 RepID=UPI003C4D0F15